MKRMFSKFIGIRGEEREKSLLMFGFIFLTIATLLILKPARNSLFLTRVGLSRLPHAFVIVAVTAAFVTELLNRWGRTVRLNLLIQFHACFSVLIITAFWAAFQSNFAADGLVYAFYAWVSLYGLITASQFWLLASYVFNAREAKRLFGFLGAGAISGGIFGGYLTRFLAPVIGTNHLLLIGAGFVFLCTILVRRIWKKYAQSSYSEKLARDKKLGKTATTSNVLRLFQESRQLAYLAGIIGVGVIVASLLDYQYTAIVNESVRDPDRLTAFFGFWLSNLSIASLLIQILFTGSFIRRAGVIPSLFLLPLGILAGTVAVLVRPALGSAILLKVADGSLKQSVNRSGLELLALPLPGHIKGQGKTVIDVLVDSLATGIGGLLLILFTSRLGFGVREISFITVAAVLIWIILIVRIRPEYIDAFRQALLKRTIDLSDQTVNVRDASVFQTLLQVLEGKNERQVLYALQLIENVKNEKLIPVLRQLTLHSSHEIRLQALQSLLQYENPGILPSVRSLVEDEDEDVRIEAVRFVCRKADDRAETLLTYLNHMNPAVRSAALICAAEESRDESFRAQMDMQQLFNDFVDAYLQEEEDALRKRLVRMTLARVIGIARDPRLYPFLRTLLMDGNPDVVEHAVRSAGMICDPVFLPHLIGHLNTENIRQTVREALARYGDDVLDALNDTLENPGQDRHIRYAVPRVLARIDSQRSAGLLFRYLEQKDIRMHYSTISALNKLRTRFPLLPFDRKEVHRQLDTEIHRHSKASSILNYLETDSRRPAPELSGPQDGGRHPARRLLMRALQERLDEIVQAIFVLLGLIHPQKDMANAYRAIAGDDPVSRANALELLDNVLTPPMKSDILGIAESAGPSFPAYPESGNETGPGSEEEAVGQLLLKDDYWIQSCALHLIAESGMDASAATIRALAEHPDRVVRETAEFVIRKRKEFA